MLLTIIYIYTVTEPSLDQLEQMEGLSTQSMSVLSSQLDDTKQALKKVFSSFLVYVDNIIALYIINVMYMI